VLLVIQCGHCFCVLPCAWRGGDGADNDQAPLSHSRTHALSLTFSHFIYSFCSLSVFLCVSRRMLPLTALTGLPAGAFDQLTSLQKLFLPAASQFQCFVTIPSGVTVHLMSGPVSDVGAYDSLPRCGERGKKSIDQRAVGRLTVERSNRMPSAALDRIACPLSLSRDRIACPLLLCHCQTRR
jgi:hypothetical protein